MSNFLCNVWLSSLFYTVIYEVYYEIKINTWNAFADVNYHVMDAASLLKTAHFSSLVSI
jgi:hypothetical protein